MNKLPISKTIVVSAALLIGSFSCAIAGVNACGIYVDHITPINSACAWKVLGQNIGYAKRNHRPLKFCRIGNSNVVAFEAAVKGYTYAFYIPSEPKKLGICKQKV